MKTDAPKTIYLKDYRPFPYKTETVELTFRLFEDRAIIHSSVKYRRTDNSEKNLELNGRDLEIAAISLEGKKLGAEAYEQHNETLIIKNIEPDFFLLDIETIVYPANNTALEGLYMSGGIFCTQCESEGFRRMTCFPDRPDVLGVYKTRIEADKASCPVLLSNGNLIETGDMKEGRHYALWEDPFPKPCYLFALVAGDLEHIHDTFTTMSGKNVDLYIYSRKGDEDQCWHAMRSLQKSMKWDEETFGREYDLDLFNIVAVSDFNMGAMENKSLNIFNTALVLAQPETAT